MTLALATTFTKQKIDKAAIRSGEFYDRNADYHVVMFDIASDWLLVHAEIQKAQQLVHDWFFFNPYNGDWKPFDVDAYLASPKDTRKVEWPAKSDREIAA